MSDRLPQPFIGRAALVTGSSRGIGRGCAIALAEYGADVVVNYRTNADLAEETAALVRELGRRAITVQADVGDVDAVDAMFARITEEFGRLDILVNNAGFGRGSLLHEMSLEDWDAVMKGNLYGAFFCAQRAARMMIARNEGRPNRQHHLGPRGGAWRWRRVLPRGQRSPAQPDSCPRA